jgi:hypothetical protein
MMGRAKRAGVVARLVGELVAAAENDGPESLLELAMILLDAWNEAAPRMRDAIAARGHRP